MATATGLTAEAMRKIANATIVSGRVQGENLILIAKDGSEINIGQVLFSDYDLSVLLSTPSTQTGLTLRSTVSDLMQIQVPPKVAEILANQPSIVQAAATKAAELAQSVNNLLKAYNQYSGYYYLLDQQGFWSLRADPSGVVDIPDLRVKRMRIGTNFTLQESPEGGLLLRDSLGYVQAWFKPDGSTYIGDLQGGGSSGSAVRKVIAPIIIGQSNAEGRGNPLSPFTDFQHKRILMADWDKNNSGQYPTDPLVTDLKTATIPLASQQSRTGLSIGSVIAKELIAENDEDTHVVILNAAAGGSGLVNVTSQGSWRVGYSGSAPQLYNIALRAIDKFKTLLADRYQGIAIEYRIYWIQGEADSSTSESAYSEALDDVFTGIRAALGNQGIPIVIGGMVPEWVYKTGSGAQATRRSLMSCQTRLTNVAYTDGVPNGGGSQNLTDTVHYGHEAVIRLGKKMKKAGDRAYTSTRESIPHRPLDVRAFWFNNEIKVDWSEPDTRWTNFVVQYGGPTASDNLESDSGWTTWARTSEPIECNETLTGLNGPIKIRLKSVNESAESLPTIPTLVIGAHS